MNIVGEMGDSPFLLTDFETRRFFRTEGTINYEKMGVFNNHMIIFQFHITIKDFELKQKDGFLTLCYNENVKPLLISLPKGNYINQPMFTKVIKADQFFEANLKVDKLIDKFENSGFEIARKKVEIEPKDIDKLTDMPNEKHLNYFEWHCKIVSDITDTLKEICTENKGHISHNTLEGKERLKFITLREYGEKDTFYAKVDKLETILIKNQVEIVKQKFEYCIMDSKIDLDSGWIS